MKIMKMYRLEGKDRHVMKTMQIGKEGGILQVMKNIKVSRLERKDRQVIKTSRFGKKGQTGQ